MLRLSKKTDYAIILLTHLGGAKDPISAHEISKCYGLPYPMVANILKKLVSSGLIKSTRGQLGGYVLARLSDEISLLEIINSTDTPFKLVECCSDEDLCKVHQCCPTRDPLIALHDRIQSFFEETKLSEIIRDVNLNFNIEGSINETTYLSRL